jgi:hypothetical protein
MPTLYKRDNPVSMTRRIQNARPCVEKMQFIFFVPPNEELEGTLHPQKDKTDIANNPYLMVRSRSEYYTSMSVSGLPTFFISVKNMNLLSSSICNRKSYT